MSAENQLTLYQGEQEPPEHFATMEDLFAYFGESNIAALIAASPEELRDIHEPGIEDALQQCRDSRENATAAIARFRSQNVEIEERREERREQLQRELQDEIRELKARYALEDRNLQGEMDLNFVSIQHQEDMIEKIKKQEGSQKKKKAFLDFAWLKGENLPYAKMSMKAIHKDLKIETVQELQEKKRHSLFSIIYRCTRLGFEYNRCHRANCKENGQPRKITPRLRGENIENQKQRIADLLMLPSASKKRSRGTPEPTGLLAPALLDDVENCPPQNKRSKK